VVAGLYDYTAAQVFNAVDVTQSYANPAWITSLAWSKISGAPATGVSSVFGRSGAVIAQTGDYTAAQVTNAVNTLSSYSDPSWISSLSWFKITGAPSIGSYQSPWLQDINGSNWSLSSVKGIGIGANAVAGYGIYCTMNSVANEIALFRNTNAGGAGGFVVQNDGSHSGNIMCAGSTYVNTAWRNNTVINAGGTTDSLILATNSVERVTITSGGNVGIGNNASVLPDGNTTNRHLIVGPTGASTAGEITVCANATTTPTSVGAFNFANYNLAGTSKLIASIYTVTSGSVDSGDMCFWTANTGSGAERMRIAANGNVGIGGTPASWANLHIYNPSTGGDSNLAIQGNSGSLWYITAQAGTSGNRFQIGVIGISNPIVNIANNGNFGLGTTNPQAPLHCVGGTILGGYYVDPSVLSPVTWTAQIDEGGNQLYIRVKYSSGIVKAVALPLT